MREKRASKKQTCCCLDYKAEANLLDGSSSSSFQRISLHLPIIHTSNCTPASRSCFPSRNGGDRTGRPKETLIMIQRLESHLFYTCPLHIPSLYIDTYPNMPKILHIVLCKADPSAGDFTKEWVEKGEAMLGGSHYNTCISYSISYGKCYKAELALFE